MSETITIGFVILSHEADSKLLRLVKALNREYDSPPIVVHHDFGQARIDLSEFTPNIRFVDDWERTGWAKWTVVKGALKAFGELQSSNVDWAFLLSAADYPIQKAEIVRRELAATPCDALIDFRPCLSGREPMARTSGPANPALAHMDTPNNHGIKTRFMMSPQLMVPIVRRDPRWRIGKYTYLPPIEGRHPFQDGRSAFYGDHWWGGNRRAVAAILAEDGFAGNLRRHLRSRTQSDESYYCSVLANDPSFTLCRDNRRFAEWNGGGAHPQILTEAEFDRMMASGAYFARKFAADSPVLDLIDAQLLERQTCG